MSAEEGIFSDIDWYIKWPLVLVLALSISAILVGSIYGIVAFSVRDYQRATNLAAFASGMATVVLVAITGWYAYETRRLVRQTEQAREDERSRERIRRQQELDNLRRALINEIRAMENLDKLAEEYKPAYSLYQQLIPSTVYSNSAGKIGSLTDEEVEAIVEYYTLGEMVEDFLAKQRRLDTDIEMSRFERLWYYISFEWLLFRHRRKSRTKTTARRISELADAQNQALQLLEQNLCENKENINQ